MRVSVDKNDPGYVEDSYCYEAYLNGQKLKDCVTADEEKGSAIVLVRNTAGALVTDLKTGGIAQKEVKGAIKIVRKMERSRKSE